MLELLRKLKFMLRSRKENADLEEEIQLHLDLRTRRLAETGDPDARDEARRRFGNRSQIAESSRESWNVARLAEFARDLRIAARSLSRKPGFTAVAVLSLAVALGANTAVFSFVRAVELKHLDAPGAERFVILRQHYEQFHMENCCFSYRFFNELRRQEIGFEDMFGVSRREVAVTDRDQTQKLQAALVTGNYFRMLGVNAAAGRLLDDSDDAPGGSANVAVISHRFWQERFAADPGVIGKSLSVEGQSVQIVGVAAKGFIGASLYDADDIMLPTPLIKQLAGTDRDSFGWLQIIARVKPSVQQEAILAKLNGIGIALERAAGFQFTERDIFALRDGSQGLGSKKEQFGKPVLLLFGLVGLVLLIACSNLAALSIVRNVERNSEAGVRIALGGSRGALLRHYFAESLLIAVLGGAVGLVFANGLISILLVLLGKQGDGLAAHLAPDPVIFLFTAGAAIAAATLFGLIPAWRAANCDPLPAIRGAASTNAGTRNLAAKTLIAVQISLSLALLFGAGLFVRTLHNLRSIDVGFATENLVLVGLNPSISPVGEKGAPAFYDQLLNRTRELPLTRVASFGSLSVLSGAMQSIVFTVPGYAPPDRMMPVTYFLKISDGYFRTLGIPLLAGRDFNVNDRGSDDKEGVAIVNDTFARKYLAGVPLGKAFTYGGGRRVRVVGVAGAAHFRTLREDPQAVMYLPVTQGSGADALYLQVRTAGDSAPAIEQLKAIVHQVDPRVPVDRIATMKMQIDEALARERLLAFLSTLMGGIAATLAAIGLYGVMAFSVTRRTREIGIRLAIGAERGNIVRQFLDESLVVIAAVSSRAYRWCTPAALLPSRSCMD